jgi:hypothetical protein
VACPPPRLAEGLLPAAVKITPARFRWPSRGRPPRCTRGVTPRRGVSTATPAIEGINAPMAGATGPVNPTTRLQFAASH